MDCVNYITLFSASGLLALEKAMNDDMRTKYGMVDLSEVHDIYIYTAHTIYYNNIDMIESMEYLS